MGGKLTTHVLDLSKGKPGSGMGVELWRCSASSETEGGAWSRLAAVRLNDDGRSEAPLAEGDGFLEGVYELRFAVGDYYGETVPSFLDVVPIRFAVTNSGEHYHVPLLVSPGGYSTYRGS